MTSRPQTAPTSPSPYEGEGRGGVAPLIPADILDGHHACEFLGEGLDDLRIQFKPDIETYSVIYTDRNGNDLDVGKLTKGGAIRLISRIAKLFDIPLEVKS